ncbi:MAG TPA: aminotransferase class IV [Gammaproteobacteria bacterium]
MRDVKNVTNVDGAIVPTSEARVPVMDRGFLYGDSIYEVFRTYQGVPLFYEEHWRRFENSARLIHLNIGFSLDEVTEQIRATIAASGAAELKLDAYVRFIVTRGDGPMDLVPGKDSRNRLVIIVKGIPKWKEILYSRGIDVAVVGTRRNPRHALDPNIKGGNYLNNVLGAMEARALGAEDCLMLNDAGLVTEASNSNVFFVIDGALLTPSQTAANLRGITKAGVHEACKAHGLATRETEIPVADARRADECFLTSATREVMPVRTLRMEDGAVKDFPEGGGPLTRRVHGYYRDYVTRYVREHASLSMW